MSLPNPLRIIPGMLGEDDEPEPATGNGDAEVTAPLPVPVLPAGASSVRGWLSAAASSHHLGGGPDGLAAHLADPHPEPLSAHLQHARDSALDVIAVANENRAAAVAMTAYRVLVAIPVKLLAKTVRHGADILDWAADAPARLILAAVIIAVIAAVFLLS
jgi:hypothetical protein